MPSSNLRRLAFLVAGLLLAVAPADAAGQIMFPVDSVESWLRHQDLTIGTQTGARFEGDRTQRTMVTLENGQTMLVKWAKAPRGGEEFNNAPRYELAAYELQKLFLDEDHYVVPPVVLRTFPVEWYRENASRTAGPTFDDTRSVLVAIHYWLFDVEPVTELSEDRLERDLAYARACGNMNILTYLIDHKDANEGNFLMSRSEENPRLFAVDNGVSFGSDPSDRGEKWSRILMKRLPEGTVDRLRSITREDLDRALGVLVQWEVHENGHMVRVEAGENLRPNRGIREENGVIQMGLTSREIGNVERRINTLLEKVVAGEYALF